MEKSRMTSSYSRGTEWMVCINRHRKLPGRNGEGHTTKAKGNMRLAALSKSLATHMFLFPFSCSLPIKAFHLL